MFAQLSLTFLTLAAVTTAQFPDHPFFIRNVFSGQVLDVQGASTAPNASVILWDRKQSGFENQLWSYQDGFLMNQNSRLVLEATGYEHGGRIEPGTPLQQAARRSRPETLNQLWAYHTELGRLYTYDPSVSVSGRGGHGSPAVLDSLELLNPVQQWKFDFP